MYEAGISIFLEQVFGFETAEHWLRAKPKRLSPDTRKEQGPGGRRQDFRDKGQTTKPKGEQRERNELERRFIC